MMKLRGGDRLRNIFCVAMLALSHLAAAEVVPDLYSVSVPVAEQSAAELQRAAGIGLREVAVRISGRSTAASEPALAPSFANAMHLLEQYRYERSAGGNSPWLAQLRFAASAVDGELRKGGLPVWGGNRPALLTMVAVEDKGVRSLIDEQSPFANILREQWRRRGLVLHLPRDASEVHIDDVMRLDRAKISSALSGRNDGLLLGAITLKANNCDSRWSLDLGAQPFSVEATGRGEAMGSGDMATGALSTCVANAIDRVVDNFSAQYAIGAGSGAEGIVLRVTGVVSFDDYSALLNYLRRLAVVKSAQPVLVHGDEILLQLKIAGNSDQLARQLALESRLNPTENAGNTAVPVALSYRWAPVRN